MQTIRKKFPQVRRYQKAGRTYYQIDARGHGLDLPKPRLNAKTEVEALKIARQIEAQFKNKGVDGMMETKLAVNSHIQSLIERLEVHGKTLADAVNHYIQFLGVEAQEAIQPLISELVDKWYASKVESRLKPLSQRTKTECKQFQKFIRKELGQYRCSQVTHKLVKELLESISGSGVTRLKHRTYIANFFNYCKANDYCNHNPSENIPVFIETPQAEFYSVPQIESLLTMVKTQFPKMLGFYVLAIFAGLRPSEVERSTWNDVRFETKQMLVKKGKRPARYCPLNETCIAWLQYFKAMDHHALIPAEALTATQNEVRKAFPHKWTADVLRHTYATHRHAVIKDWVLLAHEMNNSVKVLRRHYLQAVDTKEAEKFWALKPGA